MINLGQDFWKFRIGQFISLVGDGCNKVAIAWWILQETNASITIASVLAPAAFIRLFFLPLLGPIGDRFSRKKIIFLADISRSFLNLIIFLMAFFNYFNITILIFIFILLAIGSALFASASNSIIPQIVTPSKMQEAFAQSQGINSIGEILGPIIGGGIVAFVGISGSLLLDSISFLLAGVLALLIRSNTIPNDYLEINNHVNHDGHVVKWVKEIIAGFHAIFKIPIELWTAVVSAMLNFLIAPLAIFLPIFTVRVVKMPAWYLGGLESSIAIGALIAAVFSSLILKKIRNDYVIVFSTCLIGMGIGLFAIPMNPYISLTVLSFVGIGTTLSNIPTGSRRSIARPDNYRARMNTCRGFIIGIASPLGILLVGLILDFVNITTMMITCGLFIVLFSFLMFLIPDFYEFFNISSKEIEKFYKKKYPKAFR